MSGAHFDFCEKDSSHCLEKSTGQSGSTGIIIIFLIISIFIFLLDFFNGAQMTSRI